MCYNKDNFKKMSSKIDPVTKLSIMFFDLNKIENLLKQARETETFENILSEGERCSIEEMIKNIEFKKAFIRDLQNAL